ncbi:sensor histidine kinase [Pseudidiomarina insulisalsae]|uniref:Signal transduction histidine kinase subgroup 3 dimerisation and phosphoacceptor domain-containing protein n=1 Tax=Pseudidiomarina insulisalsae TaxID=575789 RepID=A0A432YQ63_9GAMM|nr:histidine kinase [Pseudidiomarina insulisalsae]RUO63545.1 hypothetical protein CWI71_00330 [Pseudidiomarina insulisalsae]
MQIKHSLNDFGIERWAGLLTWALLATMSLWLIAGRPDSALFSASWWGALLLFVVYIVAFAKATQEQSLKFEPTSRYLLLLLQLLCVYILFWLLPLNFLAILLTMWCAQLPYFFTIRNSVLIAALINVPHALIFQLHWQQQDAWLTSLLFWAFHLFAILMMGSQLREQRARESEQALNRELRATQKLLTEVNKRQERTRIARNIHDLLGHHLTALAIQLQVAERKSEGEVKQLLQQSQGIAKLLLADVREAVSEIRASAAMPLKPLLEQLLIPTPHKRIELDLDPGLQLAQVEVAEAVVRIVQETITNFVRHSRGNCLRIAAQLSDRHFNLQMSDNGGPTATVELGNGLQGMRDRVHALKGSFALTTAPQFCIRISLPVEQS